MTDIYVRAGRSLAALNFPSNGLGVIGGSGQVSFRQVAKVNVASGSSHVAARVIADVEVSHASILAAVRGRVADPKLRVWTFTLDGHDFFVLRLGDDATLLYDVYSEQWVDWESYDSGTWRANTGTTWIGGQAKGGELGSAVVVGDDTFGLLWFLDPEQGYDDAPDPDRGMQQLEFERIATGQVLASGRVQIPCYVLFVDGDNYGLTATDFVPSVTLETSDDQGRNFYRHDTLTVELDPDVDNPYAWYSLGQISSPGRIFRLRHNGLFARIDSMDMNDGG